MEVELFRNGDRRQKASINKGRILYTGQFHPFCVQLTGEEPKYLLQELTDTDYFSHNTQGV